MYFKLEEEAAKVHWGQTAPLESELFPSLTVCHLGLVTVLFCAFDLLWKMD